MRIAPFLTALLAACGPGEPTPGFHTDVQPIIGRTCARCHFEGSVAPFALQSYEDVYAVRMLVADAVADRRMPPWPADSECRSYDNDWSLTQAEIDAIVSWAEADGPEGDAVGDPVTPPETGLSRVDLTVQLAEPYTPDPAADDDYRCFIMDWPDDTGTFVTGYNVQPGNMAIVHHVILYVAEPGEVAKYEALDAADNGPGYTCFGGPGGEPGEETRWLGGWAPGGLGGDFKEGIGYWVRPGSKIVMQVHYHPENDPGSDQSMVELKTDINVSDPALIQPFTNVFWPTGAVDMPIPAGDADAVHQFEYTAVDNDFLIHAGNLHMHNLGAGSRFWVDHADGTQDCLIDIPRWDFNWQLGYRFTEPVRVGPGDRLTLECHWDNSLGTETVGWGDGTGDEMCLGTMVVTLP